MFSWKVVSFRGLLPAARGIAWGFLAWGLLGSKSIADESTTDPVAAELSRAELSRAELSRAELGRAELGAERVTFNRDVRPILADNCFPCHGPDANQRQGDLRLDLREAAIEHAAFVPGSPLESSLVQRILSTDPDEQMPPPEANKRLTDGQKETLQRWIAQGAGYQKHWSYEPPVKAEIPDGQHPVDALIQKRLAATGLQPSPEADRRTLIRRLHTDLIGLPPSPEEVQAFEQDASPDAYEKVVDRLLKNPHYGERMAMGWLDIVRFADTIGYHSDNPRNVWPYRDWVIESFNCNKRFDRFTLEQIAGDLLPDANVATRVGSAFNRLLLTTEEGGAQAKDYEARMLTDRVRAVGAAWLGQTTGCAQCHDHKFDPFTMRDFYSLGAFFADIEEPIIGPREQGMVVTTADEDQRLAELDKALADAQARYDAVRPLIEAARSQWEADFAAFKGTLPELRENSTAGEDAKQRAQRVTAALAKESAARTPEERTAIDAYFVEHACSVYADERSAYVKAERARREFYDALPRCIVSVSGANRRTVRLLPRGNWMDERGEIMQPALPHYLPQTAFEGRALTRLELAQWLTSRENPLTARTVMNRLWKQLFGVALSKVLDDLGAQGEPPNNPQLLDWLACEFMDSGWDVKHMVRLIVSSRAYKQTSSPSPAALAADPDNREFARQTAFRVDAELVRDNVLALAGLLSPKIGGPSAKPYQPPGYWENLNFPPRDYVADVGENQWRRGMYTWWQRSFPHPSMLAFDAPSREECCAERNRSNIPQQALVLLNDPTYVEAARAFAARVLSECSGVTDDRLAWAWRHALQREPTSEEIQTLRQLLEFHLAKYRSEPATADALLGTGHFAAPATFDKVEAAAWTHVARVLFNLHETVTRS